VEVIAQFHVKAWIVAAYRIARAKSVVMTVVKVSAVTARPTRIVLMAPVKQMEHARKGSPAMMVTSAPAMTFVRMDYAPGNHTSATTKPTVPTMSAMGPVFANTSPNRDGA
jgi:hypothetical protein